MTVAPGRRFGPDNTLAPIGAAGSLPRGAINERSCLLHSSADTGKICIEKRGHVMMAAEESGFPMLPSKPTDGSTDQTTRAWQDAVEFGIDMHQLEYLLTLTPAERLMGHEAALAFVLAAREAGIKYYGFDPRSPEASQ